MTQLLQGREMFAGSLLLSLLVVAASGLPASPAEQSLASPTNGQTLQPEGVAGELPEAAGSREVRETNKKKKNKEKANKKEVNFKKECVSAHNKWRQLHSADELKMDPKLVSYAQSRADYIAASDGDKFEHLKDSPYGENLAWHTDLESSCTKLAGLWYDEIKLYNFSKPSFDLSTGHFTQMVWRATGKVGCAKQVSQGKQGGVYLVCNYEPPGNFVGEFDENVLPPQEPEAAAASSTAPPTTTTTSTTTSTGAPQKPVDPREGAGILKPSVSSLDGAQTKPPTTKPKPKRKKNKNKRKKDDKRKRANKKKNKKRKQQQQQSNSTAEEPATRASTTPLSSPQSS